MASTASETNRSLPEAENTFAGRRRFSRGPRFAATGSVLTLNPPNSSVVLRRGAPHSSAAVAFVAHFQPPHQTKTHTRGPRSPTAASQFTAAAARLASGLINQPDVTNLKRKWRRGRSLSKHTLSFRIPVLRKRELSGSKVSADDNLRGGRKETPQRWRIDCCWEGTSILQQSMEPLSGHYSLAGQKIGFPRRGSEAIVQRTGRGDVPWCLCSHLSPHIVLSQRGVCVTHFICIVRGGGSGGNLSC